MPFDHEELARIGGTPKVASQFTYKTDDTIALATSADYFKGSALQNGDYITASCADGVVFLFIENGLAKVLARYGAPRVFGFIDYNDASTSATPLSLSADTWVDVPNDGLGAFTNKLYAPEGITELLDTNTGYLDFTQLNLGSEILVRNDFAVTPSTNNCLLEARYLLGSGAGEYPLQFWSERLDSGSGIPYQRVTTFKIYMGDLNTRDNPGRMQIRLSTPGSVVNAGVYISIEANQ